MARSTALLRSCCHPVFLCIRVYHMPSLVLIFFTLFILPCKYVFISLFRAFVFYHNPALVKLLLKELERVWNTDFLQWFRICFAGVACVCRQWVVKSAYGTYFPFRRVGLVPKGAVQLVHNCCVKMAQITTITLLTTWHLCASNNRLHSQLV